MINHIEIDNFKSIRELSLDLKSINILIGANGAGKSNFIGFFKLLKNIYNKSLQHYIATEGYANEILHFGLKHSDSLKGRIEFDKKNAYRFSLVPDALDDLFFEYEDAQFQGYGYPNWFTRTEGSTHSESTIQDKNYGIKGHVNNFLQSFRVFHFHDTSNNAQIKLPCNINDNEYLKEDGGNLAAYLYFLQVQHPNEFKKIEMVVRSVAPYFDRFNLMPDRLNTEKIRLEWKEKNSDSYFNAKHLSDGSLRFIALATLLLQPEAPQVIIIDEPELGLHPFAINKLAGLIIKASAQTQIIVSTQSVNLIDNFEPEDIITVDRKDGQSVFNRQSSEELKCWLADYNLSDLWNKNVIGGRP